MSASINQGYRASQTFSIYEDHTIEISPELYARAKALFVENKGSISTKELRQKLNVSPEEANKIMDMLKVDIRPEILKQWKTK